MEIFCGKGSSTAGLHVYAARASIIPMRPIRRIRVAEITSVTENQEAIDTWDRRLGYQAAEQKAQAVGGQVASRQYAADGRDVDVPQSGATHTAQGAERASAVRPFMVTEGRVTADLALPVETQVVATAEGLGRLGALAFERRAIVEACGTPLSLAEVAAKLRLHLNVVRVLAGDLRAGRFLAVHVPRAGTSSDIDVLRRVIDGLRNSSPTSAGAIDDQSVS